MVSSKENFLLHLDIQWSDYLASIDKISSVFEDMDTVFEWDMLGNVEPKYSLDYSSKVEELGLTLFRDKVICHDSLNGLLRKALSDMNEDEGNLTANSAAKRACEMLIKLGVKDLIPCKKKFNVSKHICQPQVCCDCPLGKRIRTN